MTACVEGECALPGESRDCATRSTINLAMDTNLCIGKDETFTRTTHIEDNGRSGIAAQEEGDGRSGITTQEEGDGRSGITTQEEDDGRYGDNINITEHVKGTNYCQCMRTWIASACERLHIPYFCVTKRMCLYPHKKKACALTVECTQQQGMPK